jgi:DNA-binding NtrC family response regulator
LKIESLEGSGKDPISCLFLAEVREDHFMNPAVAFKQRAEGNIIRKSAGYSQKPSGQSTVLIAVSEPEIRKALANMVQYHPLNTIWVDTVEDAKRVMATMRIATCFCGLWLRDGTYREIMHHLRRERVDIPIIIVSGPTSRIESGEYLSAMNIGALDCICYPFQQSHLDAILESAIAAHSPGTTRQAVQIDHDFIQSGAA